MEADEALAHQLARDIDAAFPALVAAHSDRLYSIALRLLGDGRDAEEVAQDALVRAFRAMHDYPRERVAALRLRPWLASITVNLARNKRRRHDDRQPPSSLEPMLDAGFDPPTDARSAPATAADRRETQRELGDALLRLTPVVRSAIVLRHVDGLSVTEVAEVLGRPEGTVKAQVHRGLRELRVILEAAPGSTGIAARSTHSAHSAESARSAASLRPALEAAR
jgi:RNA polymerase sigma-70 factor (ECF subfamily)